MISRFSGILKDSNLYRAPNSVLGMSEVLSLQRHGQTTNLPRPDAVMLNRAMAGMMNAYLQCASLPSQFPPNAEPYAKSNNARYAKARVSGVAAASDELIIPLPFARHVSI